MLFYASLKSISNSSAWPWRIVLLVFCNFEIVFCDFSYQDSLTAVLARLNVSFLEPDAGRMSYHYGEFGRFAHRSIGTRKGMISVGEASNYTFTKIRNRQGCSRDVIRPAPVRPWVALFMRGGCTDATKVKNAYAMNASAVLLYNTYGQNGFTQDESFEDGAVVVYVVPSKGEAMAVLVDMNYKVHVEISRGQVVRLKLPYNFKRTSVIFVSISFVVLMFVSLAWLAIYYVQRLRDLNSKGRLARNLNRAVRKALSRIPVVVLKNGDSELVDRDCCPICIESYKASEATRTLPCSHHFHKKCVDPWLLENRTCPMCKMDILNYYGYSVNINEEAAVSNESSGHVTSSGLPANSRNNPSSARPTALPQISVISQSELTLPILTERRISTALNVASGPSLLAAGSLTLSTRAEDGHSSTPSSTSSSSPPREIESPGAKGTGNLGNQNGAEDEAAIESDAGNIAGASTGADATAESNTSSTEPSCEVAQKDPIAVKNLNRIASKVILRACEIENLIQEIQELEQDSPDNPSAVKPTNNPSGIIQEYPPFRPTVCDRKDSLPEMRQNLQDLPAVDCHLAPVPHLVYLPPIGVVTKEENSADQDEPPSSPSAPEEKPNSRPPSHVVTITHS